MELLITFCLYDTHFCAFQVEVKILSFRSEVNVLVTFSVLTPERWKMLNCKMKFEISFWKTVSGEHFVATPDWISKMEIAVWSSGKGLLNGFKLTVKLQMRFENFIWKTVSGEHFVTTADWISKLGLLFGVPGKDFWTVKLLKFENFIWKTVSSEHFVNFKNWNCSLELWERVVGYVLRQFKISKLNLQVLQSVYHCQISKYKFRNSGWRL